MAKALAITFLLLALAPARAAPQSPTAAGLLAAAKSSAAAQHKVIFLEFTASWCGPSHQLDRFATAPDIAPILNKYFVFARVHIAEEDGQHPELNTPGRTELISQFGGFQGVPFIAFLDAAGNTIVTSARPVPGKSLGDNVGYPVLPEEIDWFMVMLRKAVPRISADESHKVEDWLRKAAATK